MTKNNHENLSKEENRAISGLVASWVLACLGYISMQLESSGAHNQVPEWLPVSITALGMSFGTYKLYRLYRLYKATEEAGKREQE